MDKRNAPRSKIVKHAFFDLDGVLVDAKLWHFDALNKALLKYNFAISKNDHLTIFDGWPTRKKLEFLSVHQNLPREYHQDIIKLKNQFTFEMLESADIFNLDIYTLIECMKSKYKIALCSNSIRKFCEFSLHKMNIYKFFNLILSNEDVQNPKPDPEIYLKVMKYFNSTPNNSIAFEDNKKGIDSANLAGLNCIIIASSKDLTMDNYEYFDSCCGQWPTF